MPVTPLGAIQSQVSGCRYPQASLLRQACPRRRGSGDRPFSRWKGCQPRELAGVVEELRGRVDLVSEFAFWETTKFGYEIFAPRREGREADALGEDCIGVRKKSRGF